MMESSHNTSARYYDLPGGADSPALVVVVTRPADLQIAIDEKWYRIPLLHAPARMAAEYLAFYQTGAFPPHERWMVKWIAAVRGYFLAKRRDLLPGEPKHPRANEEYFRVSLGEPIPLPRPIPSHRLRRITFISTTLGRLETAEEINDLWVKDSAQQRLWKALKQAGLEAECQYPLRDDLTECVADFALFCRDGRIAVLISGASEDNAQMKESQASRSEYLACTEDWLMIRLSATELARDPALCAKQLAGLVSQMGGSVRP
jgi:hypothetical protein